MCEKIFEIKYEKRFEIRYEKKNLNKVSKKFGCLYSRIGDEIE